MSDTSPSKLSKNIPVDCTTLLDPDDERPESLKKIGDSLIEDIYFSLSAAIMEAAILVFEEILQLRPIGHVKRAEAVGDLGKSLFLFCFYNKTDNIRRDRCFDLLREGLQLCPPGHPLRDRALHHLAMALAFVGYEQHSGGLDSLRESIILNREALHLRPDNPEQASTLENLAYGLLRLFHHSGDLDLLAEAITTYRKALSLRPPGHLKRADSLQNLASTLRSCFQHQGGSDLLAEEISLSREALQLRPVGHPQRWISLTILGNSLMFSFESKGFPELLAESICLQREAVQLVPLTEPDPGGVYISLAHSLVASFRQYRDQSALSEAIMLLRTSLRLPAGLGGDRHLETKTELAEALVANYDECKDLDHLREAVTLHRETLKSRPSGHYRRMESLQKLGHLLCRTEYQSWPEAIALYREALDVCVAGSPLRAEVLSDTSMCLLDPTSPFFDFFQGVEYLREAYADNFCHVNRRLRSAMSDLQKVESAYSVATKTGLDAATMEHCNSSVLELYAQVIGLLPRAANFGLDHRTRLQAVTGLDVIVRNAAARALLLGHVAESLEMLEEGRGVFWAQALHLRTATFDQVPRKDHQELQRLLSLLEYGARSAMSLDQSAEERERDLERRRQLNEEAEALILKIRGYAGLDRFLLPPSFDALVGALPDGYVVVVNASQVGYHALLLHRDTGLATSLKLQAPSTGFDSAALKSFLPRDIGSATDEADTRAMRKDRGREGSFLDVLTVLWTSVVQPIITELGLQKAVGRARPRLWWCVTGELGFLPIHAAGNYHHTSPVCAADYVASSYIPTLSSLTQARASWVPFPRTQLAGLLVCEDSSDSERARYLPKASEEVRIVRACFETAKAQVLSTPSAHTILSDLRSLLDDTPAHILHFACHGIHDTDPLKSALVLQGGNLTIENIMNIQLPNAVLCVLSACQTAKGDKNAPDQAVHLAASMLFCGFRSVIGTMWLMHDEDGPKVAQAFYEALFRNEVFDLDDVPYALDEAVQVLRRAGVPAQRWALFMHMGG